MPIPAVAAAAIPAVGSIVGNWLNNSNQNASDIQARNWAEKQQKQQNEYNERMWKMQNDYNSPAAQKQRMIEAGYSPNAVFGSGGLSGNTAAPANKSAPAEWAPRQKFAPDLLGAFQAGLQAYNNLKLGDAQADNLRSNTTSNIERNVFQRMQNELFPEEFKTRMANLRADTNVKGTSAILNTASTANKEFDTSSRRSLLPYQLQSLQADINKAKADTRFRIDENVRAAALTAQTLREGASKLANDLINRAKTGAEIDNIKKNHAILDNSDFLQKMDIQMRENGVLPHDNLFQRVLGGIYTWYMDKNTTGGSNPTDRKGDNPKLPKKVVTSNPLKAWQPGTR